MSKTIDIKLVPLFIKASGKKYFLYTYKNVRNTERQDKRPERVKGSQKCVGSIPSGEKFGEIIWKDEFLNAHPELREVRSFRKKEGGYYFKKKEKTLTIKEALVAKRRSVGATHAFDHILKDSPLYIALKEIFPKDNLYKKLLSLCYFLNIEGSNALSRYEVFCQKYRLPYNGHLSPSAITRLLQGISFTDIDRFITRLNELTIGKISKKNRYLALDSTSISSYSHNIAKCCYGKNKDGDSLPQINVLMVVDQQTGIPCYFRAYNGNVPDVSSLKYFLQDKARIRLDENAVLVSDKGYSSISNINRFYQTKTNFLINMRTNFSICKTLINKSKIDLYDPINYISEINCSCKTISTEWSYPANFKSGKNGTGISKLKEKIFAHIYYDSDIYSQAELAIRKSVSEAVNLHKKSKDIPSILENIFNRFIEVDDNGKLSTNKEAYAEYLSNKGIRILVSNIVSDPVEAWKAYYERSEAEYAFKYYKQRIGGNRTRVGSENTVDGKIFLQFLATGLAVMFRKRLSNAKEALKSINLSYDSDPIVIKKLCTIEEVSFKFGTYCTEVVGGSRKIYEALNIPIPSEEPNGIYLEDEIEYEEEEYIIDENSMKILD